MKRFKTKNKAGKTWNSLNIHNSIGVGRLSRRHDRSKISIGKIISWWDYFEKVCDSVRGLPKWNPQNSEWNENTINAGSWSSSLAKLSVSFEFGRIECSTKNIYRRNTVNKEKI